MAAAVHSAAAVLVVVDAVVVTVIVVDVDVDVAVISAIVVDAVVAFLVVAFLVVARPILAEEEVHVTRGYPSEDPAVPDARGPSRVPPIDEVVYPRPLRGARRYDRDLRPGVDVRRHGRLLPGVVMLHMTTMRGRGVVVVGGLSRVDGDAARHAQQSEAVLMVMRLLLLILSLSLSLFLFLFLF